MRRLLPCTVAILAISSIAAADSACVNPMPGLSRRGLHSAGPVPIFQDIGKGGPGTLHEGPGDPITVPEPLTLVLVGSALAVIGLSGRRRVHKD